MPPDPEAARLDLRDDMATREFTGFAGLKLVADVYGDADHPTILLLPGAMQSRKDWRDAAQSLARAGRYVVAVDLRGHGDSAAPGDGNYDLDTFLADLVAILAQLSSRPLIVGSTFGGWLALTVLGESEAPLASGLVMTNPPPEINAASAASIGKTVATTVEKNQFDDRLLASGLDFNELEARLQRAASNLKLPTLIVRGTDSATSPAHSTQALAELIPDCEIAEIVGGGHYVAFDRADEFNAVLLEFAERHCPREAPEYVSGSDPRTLRNAMGCFATGITVVTTRNSAGEPVGLTANSFSSVSLDPALLLFCLDDRAASLPAFQEAEAFAVNVLHIGQQPISNRFASAGVDRFAMTEWETWDLDVPIITNSLASFECRKHDVSVQGDHVVFVGEVLRARFEPRRDPLLYHSGKYRRLHFN